jgi:hypothetical protein
VNLLYIILAVLLVVFVLVAIFLLKFINLYIQAVPVERADRHPDSSSGCSSVGSTPR